VLNPWPLIGGVAKTICKAEDIIMPVNARVGDVVVLTKPLGTQIVVNCMQWTHNEAKWKEVEDIITKEQVYRAFHVAEESMCRLNRTAAQLMHKHGARAATDITGFGIMGHSNNLASNQKAEVDFNIHTLPIIRGMVAISKRKPGFRLLQGYSAETSGGLFVVLPKENAKAYCEEIERIDGWPAFVVADVVSGTRKAVIAPNMKVIEV